MIFSPYPLFGYQYSRGSFLQDDFLSGITTSGSIGATGWISSGGTTAYLTSEPDHPGIVRSSTTTTQDTVRNLIWTGSQQGLDATTTTHLFTTIQRITAVDSNTTVRIGHTQNFVSPPADGIYFEKLSTDTNWFCVLRKSNVQTRVDSGVLATSQWSAFSIMSLSGTVTFFIGATSSLLAPVATISTNYPTGDISFGVFQIVNVGVAVAKTLDHDYAEFWMEVAR